VSPEHTESVSYCIIARQLTHCRTSVTQRAAITRRCIFYVSSPLRGCTCYGRPSDAQPGLPTYIGAIHKPQAYKHCEQDAPDRWFSVSCCRWNVLIGWVSQLGERISPVIGHVVDENLFVTMATAWRRCPGDVLMRTEEAGRGATTAWRQHLDGCGCGCCLSLWCLAFVWHQQRDSDIGKQ